ncbi:DUF4234 domain-containing protein [Kribbella deserti]|uniref:DUF4234 domain-containing protein n=1 Tax=Kribbella deserti TaxID=1926257 RepID=A0ABV6QQY6_9ACTN
MTTAKGPDSHPPIPQHIQKGTRPAALPGQLPTAPISPPIPDQQPIPHQSAYRQFPGQQAPMMYQPYGRQFVGRPRGTKRSLFLILVTFGIYLFVWTFQVHEEMKRHSNQGVGGGIGLLLAMLFGVVSPFVVAGEVGQLYQRRGERPPVSGVTGLWYLLGSLIGVGPIVWFVKTNNALNAYWHSLGAR